MEKAVIIGEKGSDSLIAELSEMVTTIGMDVFDSITVSDTTRHPAWLIGSGKAAEILEYCEDNEADIIVFNMALSPSQQRNWEKASGLCVIDRQEVILEIFSQRAVTREASLQTGLARLEYSLPRLTRAWTHLSRQRGGTRGTRGEGETQLEVDRRIVLNRIAKMKRELTQIEKQRAVRRSRRTGAGVFSACIVGYTNAGKSSMLNLLSGSDAYSEDLLFATLDPTTRMVQLPSGTVITLTDTVGFIRDLPHKLVQAFHSTLEEAVLADLLINVVDASDPEAANHFETTVKTLAEIGAKDKRMITVFNKMDLLDIDDEAFMFGLNRISGQSEKTVNCSVKEKTGIENLLAEIDAIVAETREKSVFVIPFSDYRAAAYLHENSEIIEEKHQDEGVEITVVCSPEVSGRLEKYKKSSDK